MILKNCINRWKKPKNLGRNDIFMTDEELLEVIEHNPRLMALIKEEKITNDEQAWKYSPWIRQIAYLIGRTFKLEWVESTLLNPSQDKAIKQLKEVNAPSMHSIVSKSNSDTAHIDVKMVYDEEGNKCAEYRYAQEVKIIAREMLNDRNPLENNDLFYSVLIEGKNSSVYGCYRKIGTVNTFLTRVVGDSSWEGKDFYLWEDSWVPLNEASSIPIPAFPTKVTMNKVGKREAEAVWES